MKDAKGHGSEAHGAHSAGVDHIGFPKYIGKGTRNINGEPTKVHQYKTSNDMIFQHPNQLEAQQQAMNMEDWLKGIRA
jgi:hypothetical protein